jgi:hypothetical protein
MGSRLPALLRGALASQAEENRSILDKAIQLPWAFAQTCIRIANF